MMKAYANLIKLGIVIFVLLSGLCGYALSFRIEQDFYWGHLLFLVGGLFFLSAGSLALNQVQEYKIDRLMPRTAKRPIAAGVLSPQVALAIALAHLVAGSVFLLLASPMALLFGLLTVVLYNGFYTYWWKPKWIFAAIPGAIPGALPVTIGYTANDSFWYAPDSLYLFGIMFLWQMPHFWALALRFKDDYQKGNVPTLPVSLGIDRTLLHMGIYTFAYLLLAVGSPWLVNVSWFYLLFVFPTSFKVMQEFLRFYRSKGTQRWLAFFMWVNVSVLVFLIVPVLDKWSFLFIPSN